MLRVVVFRFSEVALKTPSGIIIIIIHFLSFKRSFIVGKIFLFGKMYCAMVCVNMTIANITNYYR